MKTVFFFTLLFTASFSFAQAPAILEGRLLDAEAQTLYLVRLSDRIDFRTYLEALDSVKMGADGHFRFAFQTEKSDFFQICGEGGFSILPDIYLGPGDSLHVVKNIKNRQAPTQYGGYLAGAYQARALVDSLRSGEELFSLEYRDAYLLQPDSFLHLMAQRRDWEKQALERHFRGAPDWAPLADAYALQLDYRNAIQHFDYLEYHNYYANDTFLYLRPDPAFYGFLEQVETGPGAYAHLQEFKQFMGDYVKDLFEREYADLSDSVKWSEAIPLKTELIRERLSGAARDAAFLSLTGDFAFGLELDDFYAQVDQLDIAFSQNCSDRQFYRKFAHSLMAYEALKPGNSAPPLALPDVNANTVRLSDFRGKVVYVDFWGTWCFPCLKEMPNSLALMEKFKGEDVVFLYVGLESDEEQIAEWREFITGKRTFSYAPFLEQREYPGVHVLAEGQFGNPALRPFLIRYAPTYMLIDREGMIAKPRAPRPGSTEIEGLIRGLL
jgi:thiol-disulfide isomerase/thioredoxin